MRETLKPYRPSLGEFPAVIRHCVDRAFLSLNASLWPHHRPTGPSHSDAEQQPERPQGRVHAFKNTLSVHHDITSTMTFTQSPPFSSCYKISSQISPVHVCSLPGLIWYIALLDPPVRLPIGSRTGKITAVNMQKKKSKNKTIHHDPKPNKLLQAQFGSYGRHGCSKQEGAKHKASDEQHNTSLRWI